MKTISNIIKVVSAGSVSIFAVALLAGSASFAVTLERTERGTGGQANNSDACSRYTSLETTTVAKLTERANAMKADFEKRLSNIANRHDAVDQKVATFRTSLNDKFDTRVAELKSKEGLTDVKLAAIETYVQAIKTAEAARVEAVDGARMTYRTAMKQEVTNHQQRLSDATATFQSSVKAAFATAKVNCGNGDAAATLKTAIKTARDVFATSRKADATQVAIKQLAATRTESIKAANAEFKKSAESYRATLKAAL